MFFRVWVVMMMMTVVILTKEIPLGVIYCVAGTVLSTAHESTHLTLTSIHEVATVIVPVLQT